MRSKAIILAGLAAGILAAGGFYVLHKREDAVPPLSAALATPPGVTLHNMVLQNPVPYMQLSIIKGPFRFGDSHGMTAYMSDADTAPGKSSCEGACASDWPAIVAPAGAKGDGDWSILVRTDGARQWAYRGKPLYTSVKDKAWGELKGDNAGGAWHVAVPTWAGGAARPPGIGIREIAEALGQGLVDDRGMAIYTGPAASDDQRPDAHRFQPVSAPQIVQPIGDFTTLDRPDGVRQWVYKGRPLYTYDGDVRLGDANGAGVDPHYSIALVARYFVPAEVALRPSEKLGGIWTGKDGKSLYFRDITRFTANGSHSARGGDPGVPQVGRVLGLLGCDAGCEASHPPLIAPMDAQPSGYWTIYDRPDGRRQWAYNGYALHGAAADQKPGDLEGNDNYDVLRVETVALRAAVDPYGSGLFWHVSTP
jgi:predicted lipoprotein with Yx(FWY)xxD motif